MIHKVCLVLEDTGDISHKRTFQSKNFEKFRKNGQKSTNLLNYWGFFGQIACFCGFPFFDSTFSLNHLLDS